MKKINGIAVETGNAKTNTLKVSILELHDNARKLQMAKGTAKARHAASLRRKKVVREDRRESR